MAPAARRPMTLPVLILCLAVGLGPLGCGGRSGPKPRKQILLTTEYADEKVGDEHSKLMEAQMGLIEDPELVGYVRAIGVRLLPYSMNTRFDYQFKILDQSAPNAFALPGGHIYVSRGLLQLSTSEDQLACVIGHEITHAAERHSARQQAFERRVNPFSMGWMRAKTLAEYSQNHERDADRGGQIMAARAGYDPMGMATFLNDMDAMERLRMGWSRLPSFFASHPTTPERKATASDRAANLSWTRQPTIAGSQEGFYEKLEGLVLGNHPREGEFRGSYFLHPDMNFKLRFPEGWELVNSHDAVAAIHPQGKAAIFLKFGGVGDDPEKVAKEWLETKGKESRVKIHSQGPIKVGELDGYRLEGQAPGRGSNTGGAITFIAHEGTVYMINVVSLAAEASKYRGRGRAVVRSFQPLDDEERASFRIVRQTHVKAIGGETIDMLSRRTRNVLDVPTTAIINRVFIDTRLEAGQLIKIGVAEAYKAGSGGKDRPTRQESPEGGSAG